MEIKHKFFKDLERAESFRQEVDGDIYNNRQGGYTLELSAIDYNEGLREQFPYIVVYTTE